MIVLLFFPIPQMMLNKLLPLAKECRCEPNQEGGNAHHVEYLPGEGFTLPGGGDDSRTVVVPDSLLSSLNASGIESDPSDG